MIAHTLFPTLIGEFQYPNHANMKNIVLKNIPKYMSEDGFSNESTGHVDIHLEQSFKELYQFLNNCCFEYLKTLNLDENAFQVNFVKSWFNILKNRQTPLHSHRDAHLSIVYYVNIPTDKENPIRFVPEKNRNDPFDGCIKNNLNGDWNLLNSYSWQFMPQEGTIFIFPSHLEHETVGSSSPEFGFKSTDDLMSARVCIASDIILTYREKTSKYLGLQPIENWRNFNVG
jgi:uncharacterized protein (TIGR02466 family)